MYKLASKWPLFAFIYHGLKIQRKAVVQTNKLEQHVIAVFLLFAAHAGIEKIGSFTTNTID